MLPISFIVLNFSWIFGHTRLVQPLVLVSVIGISITLLTCSKSCKFSEFPGAPCAVVYQGWSIHLPFYWRSLFDWTCGNHKENGWHGDQVEACWSSWFGSAFVRPRAPVVSCGYNSWICFFLWFIRFILWFILKQ